MEKEKDTIHINGKIVAVIVVLFLLLVGTFGMFALSGKSSSSSSHSIAGYHGKTSGSPTNSQYDNIPEKCRPPAGQDITSWKEHLGHHTETQECLKYFQ